MEILQIPQYIVLCTFKFYRLTAAKKFIEPLIYLLCIVPAVSFVIMSFKISTNNKHSQSYLCTDIKLCVFYDTLHYDNWEF